MQRGGASKALQQKKIAVVECGAVGSYLTSFLASSGVGKFILIDPEHLETANLYRHFLGAESLGQYKAEALRAALHRRFPDLAAGAIPKRIEAALDEDPENFEDVDLYVIALGDETLERRLNQFFSFKISRIHVWLEPLGLGGHVLSCGVAGHLGCYECLFTRDKESGLRNLASLVVPGQTFRRAIGGCAGTFTPFGVADAVRAASEATRETIQMLSVGPQPRLTTWVGDRIEFERNGFRVSGRFEKIPTRSTAVSESFARADCTVCKESLR